MSVPYDSPDYVPADHAVTADEQRSLVEELDTLIVASKHARLMEKADELCAKLRIAFGSDDLPTVRVLLIRLDKIEKDLAFREEWGSGTVKRGER